MKTFINWILNFFVPKTKVTIVNQIPEVTFDELNSKLGEQVILNVLSKDKK